MEEGAFMENESKPFIRTFLPGDASYISYLHMHLYGKNYHFNGIFEYYVMNSMTAFLKDSAGSQGWVAVADEKIIGSMAAVKINEESIQLRWFVVDEAYQAMRIGTTLFETALAFCKAEGYKHVFLWTINILEPARRMYAKYGFYRTEEVPNTEWANYPLVEEKWELQL